MPMSASLLGVVLKDILFPRLLVTKHGGFGLPRAVAGRLIPATTTALLLLAAAVWCREQGVRVAPPVLAAAAMVAFVAMVNVGIRAAWACCGAVGSGLVLFWIWQ